VCANSRIVAEAIVPRQVGGSAGLAPPWAPVVESHAPPPGSGLCGRVQAKPSAEPRAGLLQRFSAWLRTVARRFTPAAPTCARLSNEAQPAPGDRSLGTCINDVIREVSASDASSDRIAEALLDSETAAHRWWLDGGSPRAVIAEAARSLEKVPTRQLLPLASAFGSSAVADAQQATRLDAGAQHLLMALESAVNSELLRRIPGAVDAALWTARAYVTAGAPGTEITAALHSACESAVPLLKAGVPGVLSAERDPQSEVNRIVLERLGQLPQQELPELLQYARSEDLEKLRQLAGPPPLEGADAAIAAEIRLRPARLAGSLHRLTERFCERTAGAARIDPHALVNEIAELGALHAQLNEHCRLHGLKIPAVLAEQLRQTQTGLAEQVESLLRPGQVDPRDFSTRQLVRLTNALHALGLQELADAALGEAQRTRLNEQVEQFRQCVSDLLDSALTAELVSGQTPRLLRDLNKLENAAHSFEEAMLAFDREALPAASPAQSDVDRVRARSRQAQDSLIAACLQQTPDAADAPACQALISALYVGADLAFQADELRVGERFTRMARLYEQVTGVGTARGTTAAPPGRLASHRKFAAAELSEKERDALRDGFALLVPTDAPPTLEAARFRTRQPHADVFPKPYSAPTAADVKTARPGAMLDDVLSYCRSIHGAEDLVQALRSLHDFTRVPTPERAAAVIRACASVPSSLVPCGPENPLVSDPAAQALLEAQYSPRSRLPHDLFGDLERRLTAAVETQVLPGMIEAIRDGRL
jgi:hypothetical protein